MSAAYFDIGERPTTPPEPRITERELDAMRARIRQEVIEEASEPRWWMKRRAANPIHGDDMNLALSLLAQGDTDAATRVVENIIASVCEQYEREEVTP